MVVGNSKRGDLVTADKWCFNGSNEGCHSTYTYADSGRNPYACSYEPFCKYCSCEFFYNIALKLVGLGGFLVPEASFGADIMYKG